MQLNIRRALAADAAAIANLHFASVHHYAADTYPAEVLDLWSPTPDDVRIRRFRDAICSDSEIVVIAMNDGALCGFGSVILRCGELRSLYVGPNYEKSGVGSALLTYLEGIAIQSGKTKLELKASLNAVGFYRRFGYEVVREGFHPISPTVTMACMEMRKEPLSLDARRETRR